MTYTVTCNVLAPRVLATWDPVADRLEHFGWGVTPELAVRVGRRAGDFEIEVDARRAFLADLAASGATDVDRVRTAITAYRTALAAATSSSRPSTAGHPASLAPN